MARKKLLSEKDVHIGKAFSSARLRAKEKGVPFDIDLKYLRAITPDTCPIFHTVFEWGPSGLGFGKFKPNSPQLDRIIPELGYVYGNVAFISHRANRIKDNGTMDEHYAIADFIWEHLHAQQESTTPLSDTDNPDSKIYSKLGAVLTAGLGQDYDDFDDYCGTVFRPDFSYRAEEGGGDSLGPGGDEVEPSEASAYIQGIRYSYAKIIRHINRVGYLSRKFRERCLADGTRPPIPESSN
jgi:hypothetical protein